MKTYLNQLHILAPYENRQAGYTKGSESRSAGFK